MPAALCLGSSTTLKRQLSPAIVKAIAKTSSAGRLMRIDIHPADFDFLLHVAALESLLELARGREAVTYDELLSEPAPARAAEAAPVLEANWREGRRRSDGVRYAFTCPATPRYRHQWYWDSCFHAIVWRHFDPARARAELRTLLRPAGSTASSPTPPSGIARLLAPGAVLRHSHGVRMHGDVHHSDTAGCARLGARGPGLEADEPSFATEALPAAEVALRLAVPRARP